MVGMPFNVQLVEKQHNISSLDTCCVASENTLFPRIYFIDKLFIPIWSEQCIWRMERNLCGNKRSMVWLGIVYEKILKIEIT